MTECLDDHIFLFQQLGAILVCAELAAVHAHPVCIDAVCVAGCRL